MAVETDDRAKRPLTIAAGPYGHPFHPLLVTVPIGAWVASLVFDFVSLGASDPHIYTRGAYWLIGIGVVGAVVAAGVGVLDLLNIPRGTPAFRTGIWHLLLNDVIVVLFVVSFLLRMGNTGVADGEVDLAPLVLSIVALAVLAVSGWLGGRLSYRFGVRVADETTQREGFLGAPESPSQVSPPGGSTGEPEAWS